LAGRYQKICTHRETLQAEWKVERCPRRWSDDTDQCLRCGRDFLQKTTTTRWQAATVGTLRIEPLADSVTERWVTEDCPGRLLADDCHSRATRQARAPKAGGAQCRILRGNAPKNFSPLLTPRARLGQIVGTVSSSSASIADRIAPGSASNRFTVYRRQTLRMARSRSPAAFSNGVAQAPELVGFAEHPASVTFLLIGLVRSHT
jgi:hypothetical protein